MTTWDKIIRQFDLGPTVGTVILMLMAGLGPLYFGSVLPRERAALQIGALMALAAVVAGSRTISALGPAARPALAIAAVGLYGIAQSLPLPKSLTALVAPRIAALWSADAGGSSLAVAPMSLAPEVSRATGVHWLAVAACLAAAVFVGRLRPLRRLLAGGMLAAAVFEVVYGADHWFAQRSTIWGVEVGGDPTRLRGTFVNPDHLAFLLTIACAGGFAWLWWSVRRGLRRGKVATRLLHAMLPSLLLLMLFAGLAFTGSRAGLVAMVSALAVQSLMLAFHYRRWEVGVLAGGGLALGLASVVFIGLQQGFGRWLATSAYDVTWGARRIVYQASLELWSQFPWTGTGLGTFRQAFPLAQPADQGVVWLHAHSDVLELLVTTGIVGPTLVGLAVLALYRRLWTVFQHGRRSEDRAAGLGALGALTGALMHSVVDFGLTIPANAFGLAIVLGLASGTTTGQRSRSRS